MPLIPAVYLPFAQTVKRPVCLCEANSKQPVFQATRILKIRLYSALLYKTHDFVCVVVKVVLTFTIL